LQALGAPGPQPRAKVFWRRLEVQMFNQFEKSTLRGELVDEALRKLGAGKPGESKPEHVLLVEPSTEKRPSAFAAAISARGKTLLYLPIPIKTQLAKAGD
jgi:hypothetical protein